MSSRRWQTSRNVPFYDSGYTSSHTSTVTTSDTLLLKPREAAATLGIGCLTLKQWIHAGTIKTVKTPGGHHLIPESILRPLMQSCPTGNLNGNRDRFRIISGRNQLVGRIAEVKIVGLVAKVVVEIDNQRITSIISADAAREMRLRKGQVASVLIKATGVMILRA